MSHEQGFQTSWRPSNVQHYVSGSHPIPSHSPVMCHHNQGTKQLTSSVFLSRGCQNLCKRCLRRKTFKTSSFVVWVAIETLRCTMLDTISLIALSIAIGSTLQKGIKNMIEDYNTIVSNESTPKGATTAITVSNLWKCNCRPRAWSLGLTTTCCSILDAVAGSYKRTI